MLLEEINDDILREIHTQLYNDDPRSLLSLARVSHRQNDLSTPLIYRSIELKPNNEPIEPKADFAARLLDKDDKLCNYVQEVRFGSRIDSDWVLNILRRIQNLKSFIYTAAGWDSILPDSFVVAFRKEWPWAKLHIQSGYPIVQAHPARANADMLDCNVSSLIGSTSLASLSATIPGARRANGPDPNGIPLLKKLVTSCVNLRQLEVSIRQGGCVIYLHPGAPSHFILDETDRFPPLEELKLVGYTFPVGHCEMLSQVMDWSRLWRLSFGRECPRTFLSHFCGLLPNLKSFECGIIVGSQGLVSDFVLAIDGLEELGLYNFDHENQFSLSSVTAHGKNLRRFSYISPCDNQECPSLVWFKDELLELNKSCQRLKSLTLDGIRVNQDWDCETLNILAQFSDLSRLKLHLEIGPSDIEILDPDIGEPAVQEMFQYLRQGGSSLSQLEVELGTFGWDLWGYPGGYWGKSSRDRYTVTCTAANVSSDGRGYLSTKVKRFLASRTSDSA
ncbi:hypothetical protein C8J56DRAFT_885522 [Mycena floridula]|nr:hypothetical protein C8J56DRAFT_885522 [Mycena floridula]